MFWSHLRHYIAAAVFSVYFRKTLTTVYPRGSDNLRGYKRSDYRTTCNHLGRREYTKAAINGISRREQNTAQGQQYYVVHSVNIRGPARRNTTRKPAFPSDNNNIESKNLMVLAYIRSLAFLVCEPPYR